MKGGGGGWGMGGGSDSHLLISESPMIDFHTTLYENTVSMVTGVMD
jgi:hypothetical protein